VPKNSALRALAAVAGTVLAVTGMAACSSGDDNALTLYSGRSEVQVKPVIEMFTAETGIPVKARYGASAELAAQIAEEGDKTRADVFWSQDAGALGAVDGSGLLGPAPAEAVAAVDPRYRAGDGTWIGVTGRARVLVYNPRKVPDAQLPSTVFALSDPAWKGRVGIAPTNASFQSFVTAMRLQAGEGRTRAWLEGLKANEPRTYEGNALIVRAVNDGQLDLGLANHYYLYELGAEIGADKLVARNHFTADGDPGTLVNVAGVGILKSSDRPDAAARFVNYLLSPPAQQHFADKNFEYPLVSGVPTAAGLTPLSQIHGPDIKLGDLSSLEQTLTMLRETGLL
jgi:iron(III) transport system substrate-binding protein